MRWEQEQVHWEQEQVHWEQEQVHSELRPEDRELPQRHAWAHQEAELGCQVAEQGRWEVELVLQEDEQER